MPMPVRTFAVALAAVSTLGLAACSEPKPDKAFGEKVRAYLLEHPEVLLEASTRLQEKQQAQAAVKANGSLNQYRKGLERVPRDFVANPAGSVTVVEFFDYRCGYCKVAAPEVVKLIQANPDVRFVFKDFVIFGRESEAAARLFLGARSQGKSLLLHQRMMAEKSLDEAAILRIAREIGVDVDKAQTAGATEAVSQHLADVHGLAQTLAIEGTPAFIIGDKIIPGADMQALRLAIDEARLARSRKA